MSETFCLDKAYIGFNANAQAVKINTVRRATPSLGYFVVTIGIIAILLLFILLPNRSERELSTALRDALSVAIPCLLWVPLATHHINTRFKHRQLVEYGVTVDGEVTGSKVSVEAGTISVTYKFISPTFEVLKGTQDTTTSLVESPLYFQINKIKAIKPGTPIKVLYANRRNFVAL